MSAFGIITLFLLGVITGIITSIAVILANWETLETLGSDKDGE